MRGWYLRSKSKFAGSIPTDNFIFWVTEMQADSYLDLHNHDISKLLFRLPVVDAENHQGLLPNRGWLFKAEFWWGSTTDKSNFKWLAIKTACCSSQTLIALDNSLVRSGLESIVCASHPRFDSFWSGETYAKNSAHLLYNQERKKNLKHGPGKIDETPMLFPLDKQNSTFFASIWS